MAGQNWLNSETAVQKVILRCLEKGILVSKPVFEDLRYDLVLDQKGILERCQVKCTRHSSVCGGAFRVKLNQQQGVNRPYSVEEVDCLIVFMEPLGLFVKIPSNDFCGKSSISIRVKEARNKQTKNCLFYEDYHF